MILRMEDFPVRTLMISVLVTVLAFGLVFAAAPVSAQDDLTLVCSAPVNGSTLGVVPTVVTLTVSADVEAATATVTDADGNALEDVETSVEGAVVTVAAPFAAGATYTVALEETAVSISFTVASNALVIDEPQLVNDCPVAEEPTAEATEEPVVEATAEATEEPVVEATAEATEEPVVEDSSVALSEDTYEGTSGSTAFSLNLPADYVAVANDTFFLFPVVVLAPSQESADNYLSIPDRVTDYVVIYTTFTSNDLPVFALPAEATAEDVVGALIRSDSEVIEQSSVEVAGSPAVRVRFTNSVSAKDGIFYVVAFAGDAGDNYLLIQGSSSTDTWAQHEAAFEALVASIVVAE